MTHFPDFAVPVIHIKETTSTSNYLYELSNSEQLDEFTTVVANYQTSGKGQRGNSWESEADKNLLFSFILYPEFLEIKKQFMLSKAIAIAIQETLEQYIGSISIKWPNDIYWFDKKICGTLIENDLQGSCIKKSIIGIGINVNQDVFYSSAPNPISLRNITGISHDIPLLLRRIIEKFSGYYHILKQGNEERINELYHQSLYRKKGFHGYQDINGYFEAQIIEVLPEGLLVLEDKEGKLRRYMFKEVAAVLAM